jgi:cytochrome P450
MLAITHFLQERSPAIIAVTLLSGTYLLFALVRRSINAYRQSVVSKANGCKPVPRFPHKDPVFGLDFFIEGGKLLKSGFFLRRTQERFTEVNNGVNTYSHLMMGKRMVVTTEPEIIKTVLATKFKNFEMPARRKDAFLPLLGHGIFTTDGKEWEASRSLLRPSFNRSLIGDLEIFESHVSKMIARIPKDGSTVDLQELFFMLTLDSGKLKAVGHSIEVYAYKFGTATEFLFGQSTDVLGTGESRERGIKFGECFTYTTEQIGNTSRLGKLATIFPNKRYDDSINYVQEYIQYYVRRALEHQKTNPEKSGESSSKYVFIEQLAQTISNPKKIQDELINILIAGRDTTASLLSHLWYTLARRPDIFAKLRAEVQHLEGREPTFEQIKEMKYLQYCLNEALRLHPM